MDKEKINLNYNYDVADKIKTRRFVEWKDNNQNTNENEPTFARIALSLANDYESIYYIDMKDDSYIEYSASGNDKRLKIASRGDDFFADTIVNCKRLVFKDDQEKFLSNINKDNFDDAIKHNLPFTLGYRLVINGKPLYYQLKTTRGTGADDKYIIVGVKNVDAQVKREQKNAAESETYNQIASALAGRYEVIYYVDIETDEYAEYSSSEKYAQLKVGTKGYDFFNDTQKNMKRDIYPEDYPMMAEFMKKDNFIKALGDSSVYSITYRLMLDGNPEYVNLRAVRSKDNENHIIIGVTNINESEQRKLQLKNAINIAYKDALTGVKNKHAYTSDEAAMNNKIINDIITQEFAIVVCDVNDLKSVNDTKGHNAGDNYIKDACKMICDTYKHSPVYRIGGDEFALILTGEDYIYRNVLLETLKNISRDNKRKGLVTLACGMGVYSCELDKEMKTVFERADNAMYEHKRLFKADVDEF